MPRSASTKGSKSAQSKRAPAKVAKKPIRKPSNAKTVKPSAKGGKSSTVKSSQPSLTIKLSNGAKMPILGFGTSGITEAAPIEQAIVQVGYRHIDTAMKYDNEQVVGEACQNAIESGAVKRSDLFITTKIWHFDYQNPEKALRTSLKKLKMDYVDLYLIHWPNNYQYKSSRTPMHVLWAKLEKLVAKGLARGIGLSNFNTQFVGDILTYAKVRPVVNQI